MNKNKIIKLATSVALMLGLSACSSSYVVPGNVHSDVDYEMMNKQVSFSEYGFAALDRGTKVKVEKQRLKFLKAVDEYFLSDEGRDVTGVLSVYDTEGD